MTIVNRCDIIVIAVEVRAAIYSEIHSSGCSSVWLERLVWDQEAAGSSPVTPMLGAGEAPFLLLRNHGTFSSHRLMLKIIIRMNGSAGKKLFT